MSEDRREGILYRNRTLEVQPVPRSPTETKLVVSAFPASHRVEVWLREKFHDPAADEAAGPPFVLGGALAG